MNSACSGQAVEYRDVTGHPGYRVGDDGSVWSRWRRGRKRALCETWRRLRLSTDRDGYQRCSLHRGGLKQAFGVHRLVLEAFVGHRSHGMQCRHLDGTAGNNRLDNLCWGTPLENAADMTRHGTRVIRRGARAITCAKLAEADIPIIREQLAIGVTERELARNFGVSLPTIYNIKANRVWRHVA
jgi:hypothetical protein